MRSLVLISMALALSGCFLAPASPRPAPGAFAGPAVYVEECAACHEARLIETYATSRHSAKGIRCGQCHAPGNHPDFAPPVRDAKCGACHQPEFQQTLASKHFATRSQRALDGDRAARAALRREGFVVGAAGRQHFVGDAASGEQGGRLCAACHYDEHRLGLGAVRREAFCVGCHVNQQDHFPIPAADPANRCVQCHVRVGESVTGQVVNTHRFAVPGAEGTGR